MSPPNGYSDNKKGGPDLIKVGATFSIKKGNKMTDVSEDIVTENVEVETTTVPDISVLEAKIAELTAAVTDRDVIIANLTGDLSVAKAANYDLLMAMPTEDSTIDTGDGVETDVNVVAPELEDLFEKKED